MGGREGKRQGARKENQEKEREERKESMELTEPYRRCKAKRFNGGNPKVANGDREKQPL